MSFQLIINVTLGYLLIRKKASRKLDPIQNSIAAARQHADQLNKINLIVFLMSINSFLFNIPQNAGQVLFLKSYYFGKHLSLNIGVVFSIRFVSLLLLVLKVVLIGVVSPKIRKEFGLALKCSKTGSAISSRGIEISPDKLRQKETSVSAIQEGYSPGNTACSGFFNELCEDRQIANCMLHNNIGSAS